MKAHYNTNPMRILLVSFYDPYGNNAYGVESYIRNLSESFIRLYNHEIHILHCSNDLKESKSNNVQLIGLRVKLPNKLPFRFRVTKFVYNRKVRSFLKQSSNSYDIIEVHGDNVGGKIISNYNAVGKVCGSSSKALSSVNAGFVKLFLSKHFGDRYENYGVKNTKAVVADANFELKDFPGKDNRQTRVVFPGIDTNFYRPLEEEQINVMRQSLGITPDERIVLFVGGDDKRKGLDLLLKALELLPKSYRLIILGNSQFQNNSERVTSLGYVSEELKRTYLQVSDTMVLPSRYEPFGMAAMEAMACGTPVVVSSNSGVKEAVEKYRTGVVLMELTPESISEGIEECIHLFSHKEQQNRFNSLRIENNWDNVAKAHNELFQSIIEAAYA